MFATLSLRKEHSKVYTCSTITVYIYIMSKQRILGNRLLLPPQIIVLQFAWDIFIIRRRRNVNIESSQGKVAYQYQLMVKTSHLAQIILTVWGKKEGEIQKKPTMWHTFHILGSLRLYPWANLALMLVTGSATGEEVKPRMELCVALD